MSVFPYVQFQIALVPLDYPFDHQDNHGEMNRSILRRVSRTLHWFEKRIPLGLRAATCATSDRYLATSDDLPSDAVVHQVRSRERQVESSAARKTHCASTGLALRLMTGFGTFETYHPGSEIVRLSGVGRK